MYLCRNYVFRSPKQMFLERKYNVIRRECVYFCDQKRRFAINQCVSVRRFRMYRI